MPRRHRRRLFAEPLCRHVDGVRLLHSLKCIRRQYDIYFGARMSSRERVIERHDKYRIYDGGIVYLPVYYALRAYGE